MALIIMSVILIIIAVLCFVYGICAWNYKGPILMNKYILACDEEKASLSRQPESEKKEDYRCVAKLSFGIAAAALFCVLGICVDKHFIWLAMVLLLIMVIYTLADLFRNNRG